MILRLKRSLTIAERHARSSTGGWTNQARPSRGDCASSTCTANSQTTVLLPNPFLAPDTDKILKTPDWSRLDLWDRLRARWLGLTEPDPLDRSGRGFSHG